MSKYELSRLERRGVGPFGIGIGIRSDLAFILDQEIDIPSRYVVNGVNVFTSVSPLDLVKKTVRTGEWVEQPAEYQKTFYDRQLDVAVGFVPDERGELICDSVYVGPSAHREWVFEPTGSMRIGYFRGSELTVSSVSSETSIECWTDPDRSQLRAARLFLTQQFIGFMQQWGLAGFPNTVHPEGFRAELN